MDDEAFTESFDTNTTFTTRVNKDEVVDNYGRRLLLFCQMTNLFTANGRLGDDCDIGQFTFVSHNGLSVVDYLLCNAADSQHIKNFCVLDFNEFSDHSPLFFSLASKYTMNDTFYKTKVDTGCQQKLVYDESKVSIFRNQLRTCECVLDQLTEKVNTDHIDSVVQSFTNFMYDSTANVFSKTVHGRSNKPYGRPKAKKNAWFDEKCMEARNNFNRARNLFLKNKTPTNRQIF